MLVMQSTNNGVHGLPRSAVSVFMTDIVIPLGARSYDNYRELRYCLRSLQKHLKGISQVFIIGHKPDWITDVIHIPCEDDPRSRFKERNICNKMLAACRDERVSNDFLMVHDDHYLLQDFEAGSFPYVHHGMLTPGPGQYGETKRNTMALLSDVPNDYDSHCPILFNKERFVNAMSKADWSKWYGYLVKTLYCVYNGIRAEYYPDLKIRYMPTVEAIREAIKGRRWFSTGDRVFNNSAMKEVMEKLYPQKSKYET